VSIHKRLIRQTFIYQMYKARVLFQNAKYWSI